MTGANRGVGRALTDALLDTGREEGLRHGAQSGGAAPACAVRDERIVLLRIDVTDADQIRAAGEAASDVEPRLQQRGRGACHEESPMQRSSTRHGARWR